MPTSTQPRTTALSTEVVLSTAGLAPPPEPPPAATLTPKTVETTDSHPVLATERDAVATGLRALRRALRAFGPRLTETELDTVRSVEQRAEQRLLLSATHTVVALAGATGSGKSSLFNALSGLELSKVGVRRPTTDTATACVWGPKGADALLTWLGIPAGRQTARESALDADDQAELRGLVLLDLPDHDSTVEAHQDEVDRLVERVDMLVWVVDPQKYADAAIHNRYLSALKGRDALVMVVLNHADSLTPEDTDVCLRDLRALLAVDGLPQAKILATSATRGDGLVELRDCLVEAVAARVASMRRLRADLDDVGAHLAQRVGLPIHAEVERADVTSLQHDLEAAIGLPAVARQVGEAYTARATSWTSWPVARAFARLKPGLHTVAALEEPVPQPAPTTGPVAAGELVVAELASGIATVQRAQVAQATRGLADRTSAELPSPWPDTVRAISSSAALRAAERLERNVANVPLSPTSTPGWWRGFGIAQWVIFAVLVVGSGWLLAWSATEALGYGVSELPMVGRISVPTMLVLAGLVLGPALALAARPFVKSGAQGARTSVESGLREAITQVSRDDILTPLRAELSRYEDARVAVAELRAGS